MNNYSSEGNLQLWSTPILVEKQNLSDEVNKRLKEIAIEAERKASCSGSFYDRRGYYNLFDLDDPVIREFEILMSQKFRQYLYQSVRDAKAYDHDVDVRAFANIYEYGQRIRPHYHHACDFVSVYYVDVGDGAKAPFKTNEDGRLVVIDPRGTVQYPFDQKSKRVPTEQGMFVCHPATLWHESETFFANGMRVMISCEFTIVHDHRKAFSRLAKVEHPNPPQIKVDQAPNDTIYTQHYR